MDILLVEDNSADAYLLTAFLAEKKPAMEIHWVTDGYDALNFMFKRNEYTHAPKPDVILLDLNLPKISGCEVLKELKGVPDLANIPVIILTTSENPAERTQCRKLGADIFLSKPHNHKEFEDLVQRLMCQDFLGLTQLAAGSAN